MQNTLLILILLFSLTSCDNSEEKIAQQTKLAQEAQIQKEALLKELKLKDIALTKAREEAKAIKEKLLAQEQAKKEAFVQEEARKALAEKNKKLSPIGIHVEKNTITIDTNKTRDFFKQLGKQFEDKVTKIVTDIEKGLVNEEESGLKIDKSHINIDLNKTKSFLELWGKKMQGFAKEFDHFSQNPMDINTSKGNE